MEVEEGEILTDDECGSDMGRRVRKRDKHAGVFALVGSASPVASSNHVKPERKRSRKAGKKSDKGLAAMGRCPAMPVETKRSPALVDITSPMPEVDDDDDEALMLRKTILESLLEKELQSTGRETVKRRKCHDRGSKSAIDHRSSNGVIKPETSRIYQSTKSPARKRKRHPSASEARDVPDRVEPIEVVDLSPLSEISADEPGASPKRADDALRIESEVVNAVDDSKQSSPQAEKFTVEEDDDEEILRAQLLMDIARKRGVLSPLPPTSSPPVLESGSGTSTPVFPALPAPPVAVVAPVPLSASLPTRTVDVVVKRLWGPRQPLSSSTRSVNRVSPVPTAAPMNFPLKTRDQLIIHIGNDDSSSSEDELDSAGPPMKIPRTDEEESRLNSKDADGNSSKIQKRSINGTTRTVIVAPPFNPSSAKMQALGMSKEDVVKLKERMIRAERELNSKKLEEAKKALALMVRRRERSERAGAAQVSVEGKRKPEDDEDEVVILEERMASKKCYVSKEEEEGVHLSVDVVVARDDPTPSRVPSVEPTVDEEGRVDQGGRAEAPTEGSGTSADDFDAGYFAEKLAAAQKSADVLAGKKADCAEFEVEVDILRKRLAAAERGLSARRAGVVHATQQLKAIATEVRSIYRANAERHGPIVAAAVMSVVERAELGDGDDGDGDFSLFIDLEGSVGEACVSRPVQYACISELPPS